MNIVIDTDSGLFVPPRKEVSFNSLLSNNDGVWAHYIAQKEKVTFEQALRRIEKEVISWKQRLNTQQLSFPGIGQIRLNKQKKLSSIQMVKLILTSVLLDLVAFTESL